MANDSHEDDLRSAKQELSNRYLLAPAAAAAVDVMGVAALAAPAAPAAPPTNIVGVGVAEKVVANRLTGDLAVKVYVRAKQAAGDLPRAERVPPRIGGLPTDVEAIGDIEASLVCSDQRRARQTPSPCGVSIGHIGVTAGTIGAVVRDWGPNDNGRRYILSNNHVLANANVAQIGEGILQPGPADGGLPANQVGALTRFVPIDFDLAAMNTVDGAIAEIAANAVLREVCAIGAITGTQRAARDMAVWKHGRTTGLTQGRITDIDADIRVGYGPAGAAVFADTVLIRGDDSTTPFSERGDSGSVILTRPKNRACALLFATATGKDVTFANPIQGVLRRLRVRLV